ncbi:MAG: hypothetical protein ACJAYU_004913, partial [Bradymonadia bacterium]
MIIQRHALFIFALLLFVGSPASGQSSAVDLWIPQVDEFSDVDQSELETVFTEALGGSQGPTHIVGLMGIQAAISQNGFELPACLEGRDICSSPLEAAIAGLGANRIIYAAAREEGTVLHLTVVDVELNRRVEMEVRSDDLRSTVFQAVGAVTNASATLSVTSVPPGAELRVDGVLVGTTPYGGTLGVGSYDLTLRFEGYYELESEVELRAIDFLDVSLELERRFAQLAIETNAPGTQIIVDGETTYELGDAIELMPGTREIEIIAPGYDPDRRTLDVVAGEERSYRVTMVESAETIANRKYDEIRRHPFTLQLGFHGGGMRSSWEGGRVRLDGTRERIECPIDESDASGDCLANTPVGLLGVDLSIIYDWKWFELQLAGFGVRRSNLRSDRTTYRVEELRGDLVRARAGRELLFKLPAVGARWQVNEDWSTALRTGPSVVLQRLNADRLPGGEDVNIRRTDWLWAIDLTGRYHVSSSFFAFAEANAALVLDHANTRARLGMTIGIGINFED